MKASLMVLWLVFFIPTLTKTTTESTTHPIETSTAPTTAPTTTPTTAPPTEPTTESTTETQPTKSTILSTTTMDTESTGTQRYKTRVDTTIAFVTESDATVPASEGSSVTTEYISTCESENSIVDLQCLADNDRLEQTVVVLAVLMSITTVSTIVLGTYMIVLKRQYGTKMSAYQEREQPGAGQANEERPESHFYQDLTNQPRDDTTGNFEDYANLEMKRRVDNSPVYINML